MNSIIPKIVDFDDVIDQYINNMIYDHDVNTSKFNPNTIDKHNR